jgi:capsular polysaccharide biosynthesis protein
MRLDLQRERPVLTVVEAPEVPLSRTSPQRTLIVIISFFLGGLLGIGVALGREFLQGEEGGEEEEKVEQIRHLLHPRHIIEDFKEHVGLARSKE